MTDPNTLDAQASVLMKRGIALMDEPGEAAVREAISCFDSALEIRRQLPVDQVPVFRYGLAACWLNRADALIRLPPPAPIDDALLAYDEGILLLRDLPLDEDPRFARRLAIAYQNRGLVLLAGTGARTAAIESLNAAVAVLENPVAEAIADRRYMLGAVSVNLARALASDPETAAAQQTIDAARQAMALVADLESTDVPAAEVGLTARHVLCQAMATRLSAVSVDRSAMPAEVHEATDAADEGVSLTRQWEQRGVDRFRPIAYDLFRFGARVYAIYQPHFLVEFVRENMDPTQSSEDYVNSPEMQAAVAEISSWFQQPDGRTG